MYKDLPKVDILVSLADVGELKKVEVAITTITTNNVFEISFELIGY